MNCVDDVRTRFPCPRLQFWDLRSLKEVVYWGEVDSRFDPSKDSVVDSI